MQGYTQSAVSCSDTGQNQELAVLRAQNTILSEQNQKLMQQVCDFCKRVSLMCPDCRNKEMVRLVLGALHSSTISNSLVAFVSLCYVLSMMENGNT